MTEVLVTAAMAARIIGCSTQNIAHLRDTGTLTPVKSGPFRYRMADVEAHRVKHEGRRTKGPVHGVEFINKREN